MFRIILCLLFITSCGLEGRKREDLTIIHQTECRAMITARNYANTYNLGTVLAQIRQLSNGQFDVTVYHNQNGITNNASYHYSVAQADLELKNMRVAVNSNPQIINWVYAQYDIEQNMFSLLFSNAPSNYSLSYTNSNCLVKY